MFVEHRQASKSRLNTNSYLKAENNGCSLATAGCFCKPSRWPVASSSSSSSSPRSSSSSSSLLFKTTSSSFYSASSSVRLFVFSLLLLLLIFIKPVRLEVYTFSGEDSFARLPEWRPCADSRLQFRFRTRSEHGLIFYADDGDKEYIYLKLYQGSLHLRLRLNSAQIDDVLIRAGYSTTLTDNAWHNVEVRRSGKDTFLIVDEEQRKRFFEPGATEDYYLGPPGNNAYRRPNQLFFGGLNRSVLLQDVSLPVIVHEPRFRGSIANVSYSNCTGPLRRVRLLESRGVRVSDAAHDCQRTVCLNGGACFVDLADFVEKCDCSQTMFDGDYCDQPRKYAEATFYGNGYLSYGLDYLDGKPFLSVADEVSLYFKTKQSDGLLFYSGDLTDSLIIALRKGTIWVSLMLAGETSEMTVDAAASSTSSGGVVVADAATDGSVRSGGAIIAPTRFDDDQWYWLRVKRQVKELENGLKAIAEVEVLVRSNKQQDFAVRKVGTFVGRLTFLRSRVIYVGGSESNAALTANRVRANFRGCFKQVIYKADAISLDILELARKNEPLLRRTGNVDYSGCKDLASFQPVTFRTPESFIRLEKWNARENGSIQFKFQTTEDRGLLFYNSGGRGGDFVHLEIFNGYLRFGISVGGLVQDLPMVQIFNETRVNDGQVHSVRITKMMPPQTSGTVQITLDATPRLFSITGDYQFLDLENYMYIGGVDPTIPVSRSAYTAVLRRGLVGCVQDIEINGKKINLEAEARAQNVNDVGFYCQTTQSHCGPTNPCLNGGICQEGWNRFICDCSSTSMTGRVCERDAVIVDFAGPTNALVLRLPFESQSEIEEISFRFKTVSPNGLLLRTFPKLGLDSQVRSTDRLQLALIEGDLVLEIEMGSGKTTLRMAGISANQAGGCHQLRVDDGQWHAVKYHRLKHSLSLKIDNCQKTDVLLHAINTPATLEISHIILASANSPTDDLLTMQQYRQSSFTGPSSPGTDDLNMARTDPVPSSNWVIGKSALHVRAMPPSSNQRNVFKRSAGAVSGKDYLLDTDQLVLGSSNWAPTALPQVASRQYAEMSQRSVPNFVGQIQQFSYNNIDFFEELVGGQPAFGPIPKPRNLIVQNTARVVDMSGGAKLMDEITFKTAESYLKVDLGATAFPTLYRQYFQLTVTSSPTSSILLVSFLFRTRQKDGLLLYWGQPRQDFVLLELTAGYLVYVFDTGDGVKVLEADPKDRRFLADGAWHHVQLLVIDAAAASPTHYFVVDRRELKFTYANALNRNVNLNLNTKNTSLYIGGVPPEAFQDGFFLPSVVSSRSGFVGCMANFQLNDVFLSLAGRLASTARPQGAVTTGCLELTKSDCRRQPCRAGGECVEEYDSVSCICEMTSFEGPRCGDESFAFRFDPERQQPYSSRPAFVRFSLPENLQPHTLRDRVALAFRTKALRRGGKRATLLHVLGSKQPGQPHPDFIRIDIMWDRVEVQYNMGVDTVTMGWSPPTDRAGLQQQPSSFTLNDDKWHIVRFKRWGPNASLQVDENPEIVRTPQDHKFRTFNSIADVYIGAGVKDESVVEPFVGRIRGLVFNGIPLIKWFGDGRRDRFSSDAINFLEDLRLPISSPEPPLQPAVITSAKPPTAAVDRQTPPSPTALITTRPIVTTASPRIVSTDMFVKTTTESVNPGDLIRPTDATCVTDPSSAKCTGAADSSAASSPSSSPSSSSSSASSSTDLVSPISVTERFDFVTRSSSQQTPVPVTPPRTPAPVPTSTPFIGSSAPKDTTTMASSDLLAEQSKGSTVLPDSTSPVPSIFEMLSRTKIFGIDIWLFLVIISAVVLLAIIIVCIVVRCRSKDKGSYRVDESRNYTFDRLGGRGRLADFGDQEAIERPMRPDQKEWYV